MESFVMTRMYDFDDASPRAIRVPVNFDKLTIVVETFTLDLVGEELLVEDSRFVEKYFNIANHAPGATGSVKLDLQPVGTFRSYSVENGIIDLSDMHFLTAYQQVREVRPTFTGIALCTHVAITISSNSN